MKKLLFIINPVAGKKHAGSSMYNVVKRFCDADFLVTMAITKHRGHAQELAAQAAENGFDLVVCTGGDGTLNETVSGLLKGSRNIPVAYIPAGSTNDFARTLGISTMPLKAAEHIIKQQPQTLDVGSFNRGERYFTYVASFGAFTEASYSAPQTAKNTFGNFAYLYEGIKDAVNIKAYDVQVAANGGRKYGGRYIFGSITNTRSMAGIVKFRGDEVDLNDGLFEVTLVKEPKDPIDLGNILLGISTSAKDNDMFEYFQASKISLHMPEDVPWTLDGEEAAGGGTVTLENLKGAITMYK